MSIRAALWLALVSRCLILYVIKLTSALGLDGLVLGSSGTRKAFLKSDQGRGWSTFIECVSATGRLLDPGIIFKGKDLQGQWFITEFKKMANWHYICSPNGWTDNSIALSWLEDVFIKQTALLLNDESDTRLLILDGHQSHTSVGFRLDSY